MNTKRTKAVLCLLVLLTTIMPIAVSNAAPMASNIILSMSVGSTNSLTAAFSVTARMTCAQLGLYSYALYKSNGTLVTSQYVGYFIASNYASKTINLSSYGVPGTYYYIVATFYGDGDYRTATSATFKYL